MSLLTDLQNIADHLSPSEVTAGANVVGALIKVLEHNGLEAPSVSELLPEDHPSQISPPAPAVAPQDTSSSRLDRIEALLEKALGHQSPSSEPGPAPAGSEIVAPSSEPATAPEPVEPAGPELDRP